MILRIEPMRLEDLPAVHAIEQASFDAPWPPEAYKNDLETNRLAQYLVARIGDEVAAYGGMWLMVDEGHIITFAVHPDWRRQRIGGCLLLAFLDLALRLDGPCRIARYGKRPHAALRLFHTTEIHFAAGGCSCTTRRC